MREIAPCPFCGGKGKLMAKQSSFHGENALGNKLLGWTLYIKCNKCHSRGKSDFCPVCKKAIEAWNNRWNDKAVEE